MREQIDAFLNALRDEKGYSNNTIVAYKNDLYQFIRFLADKTNVTSCEMVDKDCLAGYVNVLKDEHEYASATVARKVAAMKSFYRHLVSRGVIQEDPSATLSSPKVRKYLPTSISVEEVKVLLGAPLRYETNRSKRDSALLELLYATGMRVSEVVALDVQDLYLENSSVHCASKTGKSRERTIPIYARAVDALRLYLEQSRPQLLQDNAETALFLNHRGRNACDSPYAATFVCHPSLERRGRCA